MKSPQRSAPAVRAESEQKLAVFDRVAAGEPNSAPGLGGLGGDRKPIKTFVVARTQSIIELTEPQLRAGLDKGFPLNLANLGNRGGPPARGQ